MGNIDSCGVIEAVAELVGPGVAKASDISQMKIERVGEDVKIGDWVLVQKPGWTEPRIRDLDLGERLEYASPIDIRKTIRRCIEQKILNENAVLAVPAKTSPQGGRPGTEYWLTEEEAVAVTGKSETEKGRAMYGIVVKVFVLARRGEFPAQRALSASEAAYGEAITLAKESKAEVLALRADIGRVQDALQAVTSALPTLMSDRFLNKDEIDMVGDAFKSTADKFIELHPYVKRRAANQWIVKRLFRRLGVSQCDHDAKREKWTPERAWSAIKFLNEESTDIQALLDLRYKSLQEGRPVATREKRRPITVVK